MGVPRIRTRWLLLLGPLAIALSLLAPTLAASSTPAPSGTAPPIRLRAWGLGPGQYGRDDFSFVTASGEDIYVGWGDSRNVAVDVNGTTIKEGGGVQIWLARLSLQTFGEADR